MDNNLAMIRHERSVKDYPKLALDDDEYVVLEFGRAKKSLLLSWAMIGGVGMVVLLAMLLLLMSEMMDDDLSLGFFLVTLLVLAVVAIASGVSVAAVHYGNKLYFTNKRIIQIIVNFPLLESQRAINIGAVHKLDYEQSTIMEKILGYGTLKMSTHEKNVMILEKQTMKSAMDVFKDNTGSVYVFKDVIVTNQQLNEINELIDNAPKMGHKMTEEGIGLNRDIREEINEQQDAGEQD